MVARGLVRFCILVPTFGIILLGFLYFNALDDEVPYDHALNQSPHQNTESVNALDPSQESSETNQNAREPPHSEEQMAANTNNVAMETHDSKEPSQANKNTINTESNGIPERTNIASKETDSKDEARTNENSVAMETPEPKEPMEPNRKDEPVTTVETKSPPMIVLLAHQRTGSSFLGRLFYENPNAFYMFEPLDALYNAMYGTPDCGNIPSDIYNFPNGSVRHIPKYESEAVINYLGDLLTCKFDKLPVEFIAHHYLRKLQPGKRDYRECMDKYNITNVCHHHIESICPERFGLNPEGAEKCKKYLWFTTKDGARPEGAPPEFVKYYDCAAELKKNVTQWCLPIMQEACNNATFRSTKTVRATMGEMLPFLDKFPQLKVISLIRDPRSVSRSRMLHWTVRGLYSENTTQKEAKLYCQNALDDLHAIHTLDPKYKDRVYFILYDDFMENPVKYTEDMYNFMGVELPQDTKTIVTEAVAVRNATEKLLSIRQFTGPSNFTEINQVCSDFFKELPRKWPLIDW